MHSDICVWMTRIKLHIFMLFLLFGLMTMPVAFDRFK